MRYFSLCGIHLTEKGWEYALNRSSIFKNQEAEKYIYIMDIITYYIISGNNSRLVSLYVTIKWNFKM